MSVRQLRFASGVGMRLANAASARLPRRAPRSQMGYEHTGCAVEEDMTNASKNNPIYTKDVCEM